MEGKFWVSLDLAEQIRGKKCSFVEIAGISFYTCEMNLELWGIFDSISNNANL